MQPTNEVRAITKKYCVGCGSCALNNHSDIFMDRYGKYQVKPKNLNASSAQKFLKICPFSSMAANEDVLSEELFNDGTRIKNPFIGYFVDNYIGHTTDVNMRMNASSGGIMSWLLLTLLDEKKVARVIHVGKSRQSGALFEYTVSETRKEILDAASSKYYPVEMSSVLSFVHDNPGEYAIVALPCFAKAIRLLQKNEEIFKKRIKHVISPICGHLKTQNYVKFLAWQKNIPPQSLVGVNFRKKISGAAAHQYGTEFQWIKNGKVMTIVIPNNTFEMGTNWGHGMFKYPVCDYCDDVFGEVADISIGDAWLPEYVKDYKGNSILVVRDHDIDTLLKKGEESGELHLESVSAGVVCRSQSGGIRHKRQDLQYRLALQEKKYRWHPPKRVQASRHLIDAERKRALIAREKISTLSHGLFLRADKRKSIHLFYKKR